MAGSAICAVPMSLQGGRRCFFSETLPSTVLITGASGGRRCFFSGTLHRTTRLFLRIVCYCTVYEGEACIFRNHSFAHPMDPSTHSAPLDIPNRMAERLLNGESCRWGTASTVGCENSTFGYQRHEDRVQNAVSGAFSGKGLESVVVSSFLERDLCAMY